MRIVFELRGVFSVVSMGEYNGSSCSICSQAEPGYDLAGIIELAKESAVLWRKHGGKPRFWSVNVGEAGNYVFSINFETFSAYGATVDKLNADPAFQTWQAKRLKAGLTTLVRANMAIEIEV
jgi:hypothetical protein